MTTISTGAVRRVTLTRRQWQLLVQVADGRSVTEAAQDLGIAYSSAREHVRRARYRLYGAPDVETALAIGYALGALPAPVPSPGGPLAFSREQRVVAALVARGMSPSQIAVALNWPVKDMRERVDTLMKMLRARNRAHFVKRAWQHGLLTRQAVLSWLPS